MAQSALHLRGDLNPALGLGLPGLTDAQGIESQQLIRTQQLIRNQQPSALDQMMAQNKSPDGLKPTMPSIEQLLAQVNANYAINSRASTGQPNNFFESATNLKALVGNDLVGNNQPRKPLGTASALNNLIQGSVQCFRHNGYGFISPADGSKEEFFHCNQINKVGIRSHLIGGETVTFNKEFDSHRKKWYATNVMLSLPVKPPLEVGTNISPTTSSNTGDKKKSKEQNYDGDDDDDDDGYSGDNENEIPSVDHRDKWGFLITAKRMSIKNDRENVKKKMTVVTMKQRLPKIPDDALSTIAKLTGDFQSILNLSIADPTLAVTISQWKCCDCDGPIFGSNRAYFRSLQEELGILSIPSTAKPFICKHGTFCDRNDCSGSNARQCSQCGVVMECGLCQKSQITDCKICTEVQQDSFYCRNCQGGCEEKYTPLL
jgi:cold shock CspA family protein